MKRFLSSILIGLLCLSVAPAIAADTHDLTKGSTAGYPSTAMGKVYLIERTVDFSTLTGNGVSGDTYEVLAIPAGTMVLGVGYALDSTKRETSAYTIDIGDGVNPNGYFDNASVRTGATATAWSAVNLTAMYAAPVSGGTCTNAYLALTSTDSELGTGKMYASADTIDILCNSTIALTKITVRALVVPVGGL